jgi:hypothetical protein
MRPFQRCRSAPGQSARWQGAASRNILEVRRSLLLLLILPACPAFGQVYSWKEAGSTRLSSEEPAWYRSYEPVRGPRVTVTVGNRLVDDTSLPMEKRLALRPKSPKPAAKSWIQP